MLCGIGMKIQNIPWNIGLHLDKVIFQAKLGTMSDKTKRIMQLVNAVTDELNITEEQKKRQFAVQNL